MSRVWKPVRDPPTLSRYISLSEDAQQLMAALEKTYNNQQKKPSQCNATPENPVPDPCNYYKSIYEAKFKAELPSRSSCSACPVLGSNISTPVNSGFIHPDCNNDSLLVTCQSPELCGSQASDISTNNSFRHKTAQCSKPCQTPVSYREIFNFSRCPLNPLEIPESLTPSNKNTTKYNNESPACCTSSLKTRSNFHQPLPGGSFSKVHLQQNVCEQNQSNCSNGYSVKQLDSNSFDTGFKLPSAATPCRRNPSHHCSVSKHGNTDVQSGTITCQMKITECLKVACKPMTFINTSTSCYDGMKPKSSQQFRTRDLEFGTGITKKQATENSNSVLHDNLISCFSSETNSHKNSHMDVDCPYQGQDHTTNKTQRYGTFSCMSDADGGQIHSSKTSHDKASTPDTRRSSKTSKVICNVNVEKKNTLKRQSTFQAPFMQKISKAMTSNMTLAVESVNNRAVKKMDMISLTNAERKQLKSDLLNSDEICMTLVFSDSSTLLNRAPSSETSKKHVGLSKKVTHLAVKITSAQTLSDCKLEDILLFPLDQSDPGYVNWFRTLVEDLMTSLVPKKIAVNAKEMLVELLTCFTDGKEKCGLSWHVEDPAVGVWLLNSERSAQCFRDVLLMLGMDCPQHIDSSSWTDTLNAEFALLHQAMTTLETKLKSQNLWKLFSEVECPLVPVLASMELQPLRVDTKTFLVFSDVLKKKLLRLEEKAFSITGHRFSINSHPQLRQVLYEELQLDKKLPLKMKIAKTSIAQQKSTSEAMLSHLVDIHPLPAIVLEYRQLQKIKSTYVDGMLACVRDGYLRTHWDQTAAATGRLTSYQPNIQAIPRTSVTVTDYETSYVAGKSNDKQVEIFAREPYISREGHLLLAADFQQIELRLLAHLSDDHSLQDMFSRNTDEDVFIALTAQWLRKAVSDVTASEREQTKRIVYSVMYGVGKERLSEYLKVTPDNAKAIMESFLKKFPAVNSFTKKCVEFCQEHGYTSTIFKRRRQIPHINHPSYQMRAQAARQAVNFCVQGSAADLCKAAMLKVEEEFKNRGNLQTKLLVQIHDELLWEVPERELNVVKEIVKDIMEHCDKLCGEMVELKVPVRVSLSVGKSWAHLEHCV